MSDLSSLVRTSELRASDIIHLMRDPDGGGKQDLGMRGDALLALFLNRSRTVGVQFPASTSRATTPQAGTNVYGGDWFQHLRFVTPASTDSTARRVGGLYALYSSDDNSVSFYASSFGLVLRVRNTTTRTVSILTLAASTGYDLWFTFTHATKAWALYSTGNPTAIASGTLTSNIATEYDAITGGLSYQMVGGAPNDGLQTDAIILGYEYGNVALTGAEIDLVSRRGWSALPQYLHAGGGGQVLYNYNFAAGTDGWSAYGAPTVSAPAGTLDVTDLGGAFGGANSPAILTAVTASKNHWLKFTVSNSLLTDYIRVFASGDGSRFDSNNVRANGSYTLPLIRTAAATGGLRFGNNGTPNPSGAFSLDDVSIVTAGLCGSWNFDRNTGFCVPDQSFANRPLTLSPAAVWLMPGEEVIAVPIQPMSADGFIQFDQAIVPAGYEPFAASLERLTGSGTGTVTIKKTSSGGTTVFTAALAASVALTPTIVPFTAADKLHLANSSWSSSSLRGRILCRRALY